jgi:hypothetical protein
MGVVLVDADTTELSRLRRFPSASVICNSSTSFAISAAKFYG